MDNLSAQIIGRMNRQILWPTKHSLVPLLGVIIVVFRGSKIQYYLSLDLGWFGGWRLIYGQHKSLMC